MRVKGSEAVTDRAIAELARTQHGLVTRRQLLGLGVGRAAVVRRLGAGRLHQVHRGVYTVGHPLLTREGRWLAAVLACGRGAVLSHLDAAAAWGLRSHHRGPVDVSVPPGARRERPGIRIHRAPLAPADVATKERIPLTSAARTLVDVAAVLPRRAVERALDEAKYLRALGPRELSTTIERNRARPGGRVLAAVLADHVIGSTLTRSELEERFLAVCAANGVPSPEVNVRLLGLEVDFLWRAARVIAETDGYTAHGSRSAFERDRRRDVRLQAAGYSVLRFTYRQVVGDPSWVARSLRSAVVAA